MFEEEIQLFKLCAKTLENDVVIYEELTHDIKSLLNSVLKIETDLWRARIKIYRTYSQDK